MAGDGPFRKFWKFLVAQHWLLLRIGSYRQSRRGVFSFYGLELEVHGNRGNSPDAGTGATADNAGHFPTSKPGRLSWGENENAAFDGCLQSLLVGMMENMTSLPELRSNSLVDLQRRRLRPQPLVDGVLLVVGLVTQRRHPTPLR